MTPYMPQSDCECYYQALDLLNDALAPIDNRVSDLENDPKIYSGQSTDDKPTGVTDGSVYFELDTGKEYCYYGDQWNEIPCCASGGGGDGVIFLNFDCSGSINCPTYTFDELKSFAETGSTILAKVSGVNKIYCGPVSVSENFIELDDNCAIVYDPNDGTYYVDYAFGHYPLLNEITLFGSNIIYDSNPPLMWDNGAWRTPDFSVESDCYKISYGIDHCCAFNFMSPVYDTVTISGSPVDRITSFKTDYGSSHDIKEFVFYTNGAYDYSNPVEFDVIALNNGYIACPDGNKGYYYSAGIL